MIVTLFPFVPIDKSLLYWPNQDYGKNIGVANPLVAHDLGIYVGVC